MILYPYFLLNNITLVMPESVETYITIIVFHGTLKW